MIKIYKNLMTEEDRLEVLNVLKYFPDQLWTQSVCTDEPVKQLRQWLPQTVHRKIYSVHQQAMPLINKDFRLKDRNIELRDPDYGGLQNTSFLTIDRRDPGMSLGPHPDIPTGTYQPHPGALEGGKSPITISGIFYWNDDIEGGELKFHDDDVAIERPEECDVKAPYIYKPVAGDFVVFESKYVHEIFEIKSGHRYSTQWFFDNINWNK